MDAPDKTSPSSRRAWIEIFGILIDFVANFVALLAEGVDRNTNYRCDFISSDRVALLAEGVDRNTHGLYLLFVSWCRPPRGGRG